MVFIQPALAFNEHGKAGKWMILQRSPGLPFLLQRLTGQEAINNSAANSCLGDCSYRIMVQCENPFSIAVASSREEIQEDWRGLESGLLKNFSSRLSEPDLRKYLLYMFSLKASSCDVVGGEKLRNFDVSKLPPLKMEELRKIRESLVSGHLLPGSPLTAENYEDRLSWKQFAEDVEDLADYARKALRLADEDSFQGWETTEEKDGVFLSKKLDRSTSCPFFRSAMAVDCSSEVSFRYLWDKWFQVGWQGVLEEGRVIEQLDHHRCVVYARFKGFLSFLPRDLVLLKVWHEFPDGSFAVVSRSVQHPRCPSRIDQGIVRAELLFSADVFRPLPHAPCSALVTHITQADLKGWAPRFAYNMLFNNASQVARIRQHLEAYFRNLVADPPTGSDPHAPSKSATGAAGALEPTTPPDAEAVMPRRLWYTVEGVDAGTLPYHVIERLNSGFLVPKVAMQLVGAFRGFIACSWERHAAHDGILYIFSRAILFVPFRNLYAYPPPHSVSGAFDSAAQPALLEPDAVPMTDVSSITKRACDMSGLPAKRIQILLRSHHKIFVVSRSKAALLYRLLLSTWHDLQVSTGPRRNQPPPTSDSSPSPANAPRAPHAPSSSALPLPSPTHPKSSKKSRAHASSSSGRSWSKRGAGKPFVRLLRLLHSLRANRTEGGESSPQVALIGNLLNRWPVPGHRPVPFHAAPPQVHAMLSSPRALPPPPLSSPTAAAAPVVGLKRSRSPLPSELPSVATAFHSDTDARNAFAAPQPSKLSFLLNDPRPLPALAPPLSNTLPPAPLTLHVPLPCSPTTSLDPSPLSSPPAPQRPLMSTSLPTTSNTAWGAPLRSSSLHLPAHHMSPPSSAPPPSPHTSSEPSPPAPLRRFVQGVDGRSVSPPLRTVSRLRLRTPLAIPLPPLTQSSPLSAPWCSSPRVLPSPREHPYSCHCRRCTSPSPPEYSTPATCAADSLHTSASNAFAPQCAAHMAPSATQYEPRRGHSPVGPSSEWAGRGCNEFVPPFPSLAAFVDTKPQAAQEDAWPLASSAHRLPPVQALLRGGKSPIRGASQRFDYKFFNPPVPDVALRAMTASHLHSSNMRYASPAVGVGFGGMKLNSSPTVGYARSQPEDSGRPPSNPAKRRRSS